LAIVVNIGQKIKELRIKNCVNMEELAAALGVSKNSIFRWESGQCKPRLMYVERISRYFGVSKIHFFENSDAQTANADSGVFDLPYSGFVTRDELFLRGFHEMTEIERYCFVGYMMLIKFGGAGAGKYLENMSLYNRPVH
jgi:transcriptional regulator with XRE-family HTH domain